MAMNTLLKLFRIFTKIHEYIRKDKFNTGVNEKYFETAKGKQIFVQQFYNQCRCDKLLPVSL
jgi:hypothetical protein